MGSMQFNDGIDLRLLGKGEIGSDPDSPNQWWKDLPTNAEARYLIRSYVWCYTSDVQA